MRQYHARSRGLNRDPHVHAVALGSNRRSGPRVIRHLTDEVRADVAIIGAGYTGLSAALQIAADGRRAGGAGSRHGRLGCERPQRRARLGKIPRSVSRGRARCMDEKEARRLHRIGKQAVEIRGGTDPRARHRLGGLQDVRATSPRPTARRRSPRSAPQPNGSPARLAIRRPAVHDREEVAAETGSSTYLGGVLNTAAGSLHPLNYVRGLARAAVGRGVRDLREQPGHARISATARSIRVETPHGSRACPATHRSRPMPIRRVRPRRATVRRRFIPFRSAIIATAPLSERRR